MEKQRIVIELDWGTEPVSGWLRPGDGDGPGRPFSGYVSLLAALDALRPNVEVER
jgi:hypothetical protein